VGLCGWRSSQAAQDDLPAGQPDELNIGGQVALPQLAGLHQKPPEPLQPQRLRPARSTPDEAGQHVEAAAYTHDDRHLKALPVELAPGLLEGGRHTNEQDVGPAGPDLLDDAQVIVQAEIAVAEAGDLDAGVVVTARFYQSRDYLAPGAEEIDAQPV